MKFYVKVILSLLVGVFLELTVFQLGAWRARFDPSAPKDQRYELADMTAVNWEKDGDAYISGADPILLLPSEGMRVYRVTAGFPPSRSRVRSRCTIRRPTAARPPSRGMS